MKPIFNLSFGRLRPVNASDSRSIMDLLHSPSVRQFLCDDQLVSSREVADMLDQSAALDTRGLGLWVIETELDNVVGLIGLTPVTAELEQLPGMRGGIEPTIAVAPEYQGQGVAQNAMTTIVEYAKRSLNLDGLVAAVDKPNTHSHRLLQAIGFCSHATTKRPTNELVLYGLRLQCE